MAALPLVTAGYFSKDLILWRAWAAPGGGSVLWTAGAAGALVTALYIFLAVFVVFFGRPETEPRGHGSFLMSAPVAVLAVLAVVGGAIAVPGYLEAHMAGASASEIHPNLWFEVVSAAIPVIGIALAYAVFGRGSTPAALRNRGLARLWDAGWGFDRLYDGLFVRPFVGAARGGRDDPADAIAQGATALSRTGHVALSRAQNGRLRWYAVALAGGAAVLLVIGGVA